MDKNHIISVGKLGSFSPSGKYTSTKEDIQSIIDNFFSLGKSEITLFFHGGLVNESDGINSANFISSKINNTGTYPISFVWKTGVLETLTDKLEKIKKTKLFNYFLKFIIAKASSRIKANSNAKGIEEISYIKISEELEKEIPFQNFEFINDSNQKGLIANHTLDKDATIYEITAELEGDIHHDNDFMQLLKEANFQTEFIDQSLAESPDKDAKGIITLGTLIGLLAKIVFKIVSRFLNKRDHGFFPTIIEETLRGLYLAGLGANIWTDIKDKAADVWNNQKENMGAYFIDQLNNAAKDKGKKIQLNLIGHSAGSIVICHLFDLLGEEYTNIKVNHIIFLAPAVDSLLFHTKIVTKPHRFHKFRMFTMKDEVESNDALIDSLPSIYPRSLLYLVSGIFEKEADYPILGMARFLKSVQLDKEYSYLEDIRNFLLKDCKIVFSPTDFDSTLEGYLSQAIDHGSFYKDDSTIQSIIHLLTK